MPYIQDLFVLSFLSHLELDLSPPNSHFLDITSSRYGGGRFPSPSPPPSFPFPPLNPNNPPIQPGGLGTGHSLLANLAFVSTGDSPSLASPRCRSTTTTPSPSICFRLRRRRGGLDGSEGAKESESESARRTRGAGQGRMCGMVIMTKDMRRVVQKREEVNRERGWRWGGILPSGTRRCWIRRTFVFRGEWLDSEVC